MELTEEQKQDVSTREKQFMERYEDLTKELEMDFAQFPQLVPIGNGLFGIAMGAQLRDKRYLSPISPFIPNKN